MQTMPKFTVSGMKKRGEYSFEGMLFSMSQTLGVNEEKVHPTQIMK